MKRLFAFSLLMIAAGCFSVRAARAQECDISGVVQFHTNEIIKSTEEAKIYDPKTRLWMVHPTNDNYVLYATSKTARDEWLGMMKIKRGDPCDKIDPALDALAIVVKEKMKNMAPNAADFRFHDPVAEKIMLTALDDQKNMKVIKIGLDSATWDIQKDSSNFPSYRYKDGYIWARDTSESEPSCHLFNIRVKQDYAGGGTYSGKMYRASALDNMTGCPAGPAGK
jgi:hypothetical protein